MRNGHSFTLLNHRVTSLKKTWLNSPFSNRSRKEATDSAAIEERHHSTGSSTWKAMETTQQPINKQFQLYWFQISKLFSTGTILFLATFRSLQLSVTSKLPQLFFCNLQTVSVTSKLSQLLFCNLQNHHSSFSVTSKLSPLFICNLQKSPQLLFCNSQISALLFPHLVQISTALFVSQQISADLFSQISARCCSSSKGCFLRVLLPHPWRNVQRQGGIVLILRDSVHLEGREATLIAWDLLGALLLDAGEESPHLPVVGGQAQGFHQVALGRAVLLVVALGAGTGIVGLKALGLQVQGSCGKLYGTLVVLHTKTTPVAPRHQVVLHT